MSRKNREQKPHHVHSPGSAQRERQPVQPVQALVRFEAKNASQRAAFQAARSAEVIFLVGPAGTGKTTAAVGLALTHALARGEKVSVCRPAIEASAGIGYLKGTLSEKYGVWAGPVLGCARKVLLGKVEDHLSLCPMPYLRGTTFDGAAILDEAQNCTTGELLLFLTRLGRGGKLFISGDPYQSDISDSGLIPWMKALRGVSGVAQIIFQASENLRSPLVEEIFRRRPR